MTDKSEEAIKAKSEEAIKAQTAQRMREIELLRAAAHDRGLAFAALREEQVAAKVRGTRVSTRCQMTLRPSAITTRTSTSRWSRSSLDCAPCATALI
jgi:predicted methyltransferase MtxX (methanogen marker protein 4)